MIKYLFRMLPKLLQPISQVNDELWLSLKHTGPQYSPLKYYDSENYKVKVISERHAYMYNNPLLKNNKIMFVRWYI